MDMQKKNDKINLRGGGVQISIILPVYNGEKYIKNCLGMLLDQEGDNYEIIIINDGSTDRTEEIIRQIQDDRIVYFKQSNQGVSAARNKGMELSRGNWIVFVDVDDEINSGYISDINKCIDIYSDCDIFVYAKSDVVGFGDDRDLSDISSEAAIIATAILNGSTDTFKGNGDYHFDGPWSKVYSKNFLISNGLKFNINISYGEDLIFLLKVFYWAKKIKLVHRGYYNYIQNTDSVCHTIPRINEKNGYIILQRELQELIKKDLMFWRKEKIIDAFDHYFFNWYSYYSMLRVLQNMEKNKRETGEIIKAIQEMNDALKNSYDMFGKRRRINKVRIKIFIAKVLPRVFIKRIKKHAVD